MDCGEQALLPAVRQADPGTLIVADGFSCKTQIAHSGTARRALHTAEVMKIARDGRSGPAGPPRPSLARRTARIAVVAIPALTAFGATAVIMARRSSLPVGRFGPPRAGNRAL
jgi:hypothetical protein